jgi:DNA-binding transcriptional LysR family regulator
MTEQKRTPLQQRTIDLDWEDLRFALALARHGSLSAAARALGVNHATVSRRIDRLQGAIGQLLFDRRKEGYRLTDTGQTVLDQLTRMDEAVLSLLSLPLQVEEGGLVRLTAARVLADGFLVDRLGELRQRLPTTDIELLGESRLMSLARREADIAIRLGAPKDSDLVGKKIGIVGYGFYAASAYLAELADGAPLQFVGFDPDSHFVLEAAWMKQVFPGQRIAFRSNSQTAQAAAARAGFGIALLPHYLAAEDPGLQPAPVDAEAPQREVWLLMRKDLAEAPRIRAVAEEIAELFNREKDLLVGKPLN